MSALDTSGNTTEKKQASDKQAKRRKLVREEMQKQKSR